LLILISIIPVTEAQKTNPSKLTTPKGVRLLNNKSFDDSEQARKEILELYKDLRLTDVLDGMDLIGLQDIGLMYKDIWYGPDWPAGHRLNVQGHSILMA
jgi:hypothetical protein